MQKLRVPVRIRGGLGIEATLHAPLKQSLRLALRNVLWVGATLANAQNLGLEASECGSPATRPIQDLSLLRL